ncbi:hypothetical protein CR969_00115, partial [Candidatus Saccharibacteria bacterium]
VNKASTYDPNAGSYTIDKLDFWGDAGLIVEKGASCSERSVVGLSSMNITSVGNLTDQGVMRQQQSKYTVSGNLSVGYRSFTPAAGSSADSLTKMTPTKYSTAFGCSQGMGGAGGEISNISYNSLKVQKGASASMYSNFSKPITFGGGSSSNDPSISFYSEDSATKTYSWTSPVTLLSNVKVFPGDNVTVNFTGTIDGSGFSLYKNTYAPGVFNNNATSDNSNSQTGTVSNPVKKTKLEGKTNEVVTVVDNETAILTGERRDIYVQNGGILKGNGTIREGLYVAKGATVAPGMSPGCLTAGSMILNGTYDFEIGGKTACTQYDQIRVTGVSTPGVNSVEIQNSAKIEVYGLNDFVLSNGDKFVIIDNRSSQPVSGTFSGLAEGDRLTVGDVVFSISYKGGDGNDVELTVLRGAMLPQRPNSGIAQLVSANPALVAITGVAAAIAVAVLARGKKYQS